jgi:hypothetical protein
MWENDYDLDVALGIVSTMRAIKSIELDKETDSGKRNMLEKEMDTLYCEREALYAGGEVERSLINKAFNIYAPIIKARHAPQ